MSTQPKETLSYREMVEALDLKQMGIEMAQFSRDSRYLASIRSELREQHPDCWVAVYGGEVVAAGPVLSEVLSKVVDQGIPRGNVALEYISKEPMMLIV